MFLFISASSESGRAAAFGGLRLRLGARRESDTDEACAEDEDEAVEVEGCSGA